MNKTVVSQWNQVHRKLSGFANHMVANQEAGAWTPNTDVCIGADDLRIKVELAGVEKENVRLTLEGQELCIQGCRRDPYSGESTAGYRFQQMEIEYGPFKRIIPLPYPVSGESASARFDHGILRITLPRAHAPGKTSIHVITEG